MLLRILSLIVCLLCMSYNLSYAGSNQFSKNSLFYNIEQDYLNGNISLDDKVILYVNSVRQRNKSLLKYQSLSSSVSSHKDCGATMALIDMRIHWDELTEATKIYVSKALARDTMQFTFISPSGYFKLHYDVTDSNAVPTEDLNLNSIPDFIENCAAYADTSLSKHLELGYMYPPNDGVFGGDSLYDLYFENISYYGVTIPEGIASNPWNDYYSYIILNKDFLGFPANSDPEGQVAGAAKVTIAHEFQHAVQFGYDVGEGSWAMEAAATYIEEVIFDTVNDNYIYLDDYLTAPHTSLMDNSGNHKYGAFLWPLYLAQKFDTLLNVSAWQAARFDDLFTAYSDTLFENYGWVLDSAYIDFTYWIFNTASHDDGLHFSEGSGYYPLSIGASHISYPIGITNFPANVGGYGAGYITFFPGSEIGKLKITFNGSNTRNWSAYIIKSTTENSHTIEYLNLDSVSQNGEIVVENFENYYSITLVGANIDEHSSGVLYTYSAEIIQPFEVVSQIALPIDSAIYSGGTRTFDIIIYNTAIVDDIYNLIYWDTQGWLPMDTFAIAIASGDSAIVSVDVNPPQGTALGSNSLLTFKAESWGDSTVFDIQSRTGQIDLFRGDVNFTGAIDISDLIFLVEYSFNSGPAPQPVLLSGDFNCSNAVDISDIVTLVDYMFSDGAYPPCNPY